MSTGFRRPSQGTGVEAPDPSRYVATVTQGGPTWPAGTLEAAADTGMLVGGRERLLAGFGAAATLGLPGGLEDVHALAAAQDWLAAVECDAPDGGNEDAPPPTVPGPVALGAFPFDRTAPATLVVPAVTWCKDARGRTWRVDVRRRGAGVASGVTGGAHDGACPAGTGAPPSLSDHRDDLAREDRPAVVEVPPPAGYAAAVEAAVADIRAGRLHKVVLGRTVEVSLPVQVAASAILRTLWATARVFSPFSVPTPDGRLVGASPELLVGRRGRAVTSHAFAGTVPLSPGQADADADAEWLAGSAKDRNEHRLVVDEIVAALGPRCDELTVPAAPTVVRLRSDARLGTLVRGSLAGGGRADGSLALLARLHPTPAVGGVPRGLALERIAELEPLSRGYWAGALGWTDGAGDGEWVLGIRSVELDGFRARVRAGAGIVEDSDPRRELAETTVKLRPVLEALWPGTPALL